MPALASGRTLDFIRSHQNPDGGWGYRSGGTSFVEPTAFSILALSSGGEKATAARGLDFLKACQAADGAVRDSQVGGQESWMAYAALLAYHALGAAAEERRLIAWMLDFKDGSSRLPAADREAIRKLYRYDASIPGWPWTAGATSWVESTALFVIALERAGVPSTHDRIAAGSGLLVDRRVPSGGWNFGNPFSKSFEMPGTALSTALAVIALRSAGYAGSHPAIASGLRFLERGCEGEISTVSLAWSLLAMKSCRAGDPFVSKVTVRLAGSGAPDGSFRRNLFESALAYLALEDPSPVILPSRPQP